MSLSDRSGHDDQQLVWYLLGLLPEEDAEHLDELSISDDEVAWRLRVVENDLIDAYVAGTLTGETLKRFESVYLSSERRRQKVKFAGSFLGAVERQAAPADAGARRDAIRPIRQAQDSASPKAVPSYERKAPRAMPVWGLAAAATLLLVACGALLFQEGRLRNGLNEAQTTSAALERRARGLEQQLTDQRTANAETARELERVRESMAALAQEPAAPRPRDRASVPSLTTALVLLPQTRAVGPIASLTVPEGTDRVTFELRLESNEFPRYEVALKDPATNQIVWRSGRLTSFLRGNDPAVTVIVPASVLKPQHYSLELIGRKASGASEVVGSYTVRIAPR
jgi:hypothetical protein